MTNEELKQLHTLKTETKIISEQIEKLKAKTMQVTQIVTGMPKSQSSGRGSLEEYYAELADAESELEQEKIKRDRELLRLMQWIRTIDDSYIRQIMYLRYADDMSWQAVAMHIGGGNTADGVRKACVRYMQTQTG